jgi:hypothetical protein
MKGKVCKGHGVLKAREAALPRKRRIRVLTLHFANSILG